MSDFLGPPGGAGVHSILWAIGESLGRLPAGQVLGKGSEGGFRIWVQLPSPSKE